MLLCKLFIQICKKIRAIHFLVGSNSVWIFSENSEFELIWFTILLLNLLDGIQWKWVAVKGKVRRRPYDQFTANWWKTNALMKNMKQELCWRSNELLFGYFTFAVAIFLHVELIRLCRKFSCNNQLICHSPKLICHVKSVCRSEWLERLEIRLLD